MKFFYCLVIVAMILGCNNDTDNTNTGNGDAPSNVQRISFAVNAVYPHDTSSFTQGLLFYKGRLIESTGLEGHSKILETDLKTGAIKRKVEIPNEYFGEGIAVIHDTLYQLTWKNNVVFVYTPDLKKIKEFRINTDGWGITADSSNLIVSDGSSNLYFYEPSTMRLMRTQGITEDGSPAVNLNELEYINGFIYANQWQYNYILKIDPNSGQVVGKIDLSELNTRAKSKSVKAEFLNGIAYNPDTKKVYVTGKLWPELYEISFNF